MRNAVLFTLAATSINPNNVFADTYVEAIKVEKSLKAVKLDLEQNSFIKEQVQLFIDKETAKFVDFYQSKILDVNEYFTEQLLPTRTMIGDILVNKIELKEEEILPEVLNHYHMNEADYNSLVKYIMESSSEQEIHWNERAEITKMLYMSSTIPNAKKLETVLYKLITRNRRNINTIYILENPICSVIICFHSFGNVKIGIAAFFVFRGSYKAGIKNNSVRINVVFNLLAVRAARSKSAKYKRGCRSYSCSFKFSQILCLPNAAERSERV